MEDKCPDCGWGLTCERRIDPVSSRMSVLLFPAIALAGRCSPRPGRRWEASPAWEATVRGSERSPLLGRSRRCLCQSESCLFASKGAFAAERAGRPGLCRWTQTGLRCLEGRRPKPVESQVGLITAGQAHPPYCALPLGQPLASKQQAQINIYALGGQKTLSWLKVPICMRAIAAVSQCSLICCDNT
jgi:hypothetical protein